ncbi:MAG: uracil-DNA glycosylase [Alphaproteobacteria bacterium]|nr:uracil-DNA glycosylase [Alphaproteobacteria bacterium]
MNCPDKNCALCPRLKAFRDENIARYQSYFNAPVPSFGDIKAPLLIIGLAPGLNGANQTGRPFTNDYAGDILYPSLKKFGFAKGDYQKRADDGFCLLEARVTNAVRCVPPQNKVTSSEVKNCRSFLQEEIKSMKNLKIILCLGNVSHNALLGALGYTLSRFKFVHGKKHILSSHNLILFDSYHTSRYNINTGVLTAEMFEKVIEDIKKELP